MSFTTVNSISYKAKTGLMTVDYKTKIKEVIEIIDSILTKDLSINK